MTKIQRSLRKNSLRKFITSLVVIAFFAFPFATTVNWLYRAMASEKDPRKVVKAEPLNSRDIDKESLPIKPFTQPIVTVTFDDGWESIYSSGFPLLQKYGIPTTQYILGGEFDNLQYLSEKQIKSMQEAGHEIASHTMTHENLTAINETDRRWELGESKRILSEKFGPIRDFASPLGAEDDDTVGSIKQFYRSNRNTETDPSSLEIDDINVARNFDIYSINAFTVRSDTSIDEIKALIEYNQQNNGWLILTYHQVDYTGSEYSVTPEVLEAQLKIISESTSRIMTMGKTLDAIVRQERNQ